MWKPRYDLAPSRGGLFIKAHDAAGAASHCTVPSNNNAAFQSAFLKPHAGSF
jgi:hypothetical protein